MIGHRNYFKTNHFQQLISFLLIHFDIRNKEGYVVGPAELHKACVDIFPRIDEYVKVYNECIDMIGRLGPTINTTFHMLLDKEFNKPLHLLTVTQLYKVKSMLLNRL